MEAGDGRVTRGGNGSNYNCVQAVMKCCVSVFCTSIVFLRSNTSTLPTPIKHIVTGRNYISIFQLHTHPLRTKLIKKKKKKHRQAISAEGKTNSEAIFYSEITITILNKQ